MEGDEYRLVMFRGYWHAAWQSPTGIKRRSLRTTDRAVAAQRLSRLTAEIKAARPPEIVAAIIDRYASQPERPGKAAQYRLKAPRQFFGNMVPEQITEASCLAYGRFRQGMASGTIRTELLLLQAALNWAKATGHEIKLPEAGPPRERVLSRQEAKRLRIAARQSPPHIRLFLEIALTTGQRKTAILELTWDRVDFARGMIDPRTGRQSRNKRRVQAPMNRRLRRYLQVAHRHRTSNHVIEWNGKPVKDVKRSFATICRAAGIEDVSPHTMRHTAATWMVQAGVPIQDVAALLGITIKVAETTYAKWAPDYLRTAASALN